MTFFGIWLWFYDSIFIRLLFRSLHIFVFWFLVIWSLQLHDFLFVMPILPCKMWTKLHMIFSYFCNFVVKSDHKRKMGWTKQKVHSKSNPSVFVRSFHRCSTKSFTSLRTESFAHNGVKVILNPHLFFLQNKSSKRIWTYLEELMWYS